MKICLTSQRYPPGSPGGIGVYTANMARGLARAGHRVSVITRACQGAETITQEDGVSVYRVLPAHIRNLSEILHRYGDGQTFADVYLYSRSVAAKAREIVAHNGCDVVESPDHGAEGFALALSGVRVPHIIRYHIPHFMVNEEVGHRLSLGGRIVHFMESTTARRAALNTFPSRALAEIAGARFKIPLERIRVIPNSVDTARFQPSPRVSPHPPTVLYTGKVAPLKGSRVLSEAIPLVLRRVSGARVVIVGPDSSTERTRSSKAEMHARFQLAGVAPRVTILEKLDHTALVRFYQEADVCVLPSLWENFPNTCLEAMACGVPVVASAVGGLPEIIQDGIDGVLVPPNNPARLANEVVTLLERPELRLAMGQAARRKVLNTYSVERVVGSMVEVYEEAIARSSA